METKKPRNKKINLPPIFHCSGFAKAKSLPISFVLSFEITFLILFVDIHLENDKLLPFLKTGTEYSLLLPVIALPYNWFLLIYDWNLLTMVKGFCLE